MQIKYHRLLSFSLSRKKRKKIVLFIKRKRGDWMQMRDVYAVPKIVDFQKMLTHFELIIRIIRSRFLLRKPWIVSVHRYGILIIHHAKRSSASNSDNYSASYNWPRLFLFLNCLMHYEDRRNSCLYYQVFRAMIAKSSLLSQTE